MRLVASAWVASLCAVLGCNAVSGLEALTFDGTATSAGAAAGGGQGGAGGHAGEGGGGGEGGEPLCSRRRGSQPCTTTAIDSAYATAITCAELPVAGVAGLQVDDADPSRIYVTVDSHPEGLPEGLYTMTALRDTSCSIVSLVDLTFVAGYAAPDALGIGPGGVLHTTLYPAATLLQIDRQSGALVSSTGLATFGVGMGVALVTAVPAPFPGAGGVKIATYPTGSFYDLAYSLTTQGYEVQSAVLSGVDIDGAAGAVYIDDPVVSEPAILVSEWHLTGPGHLASYNLDANGTPIVATRRIVATTAAPLGSAVDPQTGDVLVVVGEGQRLARLTGFSSP